MASPGPSPAKELRMNAYYYSFEPTGVRAIDRILSAVASAGKAYHSTEAWNEDTDWEGKPNPPHPEFRGASWQENIQNAANDAAGAAALDEVASLRAERESAQTVYANIEAWLTEHAVKVETHDWAHFKSALAYGFRTYAKYLRELSAGRPPFIQRLDECRRLAREATALRARVAQLEAALAAVPEWKSLPGSPNSRCAFVNCTALKDFWGDDVPHDFDCPGKALRAALFPEST